MRGLIGYFDLEAWWATNLSQDERELIKERHRHYSMSNSPTEDLEETNFINYGTTAAAFIGGLASLFSKDGERKLAYKLLAKAESLITETTPILDIHFIFHDKIIRG